MPLSRKLLAPLMGLVLMLALPSVAAAASLRWGRPLRLESVRNGGLDSVSCADLQLCVAGDASGDIVVTTTPERGRWSPPVRVDGAPLTGISCPTTRFCAAVDGSGDVVVSSQPTRGARYWTRPARIDRAVAVGGNNAGLAAVSCPAPTLCVAVDNAQPANVLYSSDPTGGAGTWHSVALQGPATSVNCPTVTTCIVAGTERYLSTDPTSPTSWKASGALSGAVYSAVDCQGVNLCVGVGFGDSSPGFENSTRRATGVWSQVYEVAADPPAVNSGLLDAVGCTRGTCVALDGFDNAYQSSAPVTGVWGGEAPIRPKSASQTNAVSCTSGMCVVVDSAGVETLGLLP